MHLQALFRLDADGTHHPIHVHAPAMATEMASALLGSAVRKALPSGASTGTWRITITGEGRAPNVTLERIAEPGRTVLSAVVQRESEESLHILDAHVDGTTDPERARTLLSEAAATLVKKVRVGESVLIEVVVG